MDNQAQLTLAAALLLTMTVGSSSAAYLEYYSKLLKLKLTFWTAKALLYVAYGCLFGLAWLGFNFIMVRK